MSDYLVSREGLEKMREELAFLKGHERMRIADVIREARSHGDLRENAMYHEAKLNQKRLESRIAELERAVEFARVVDPSGEQGVAELGSKVKLKDLTWDDEMIVTLVGSFEADPEKDLVSISSPIGKAALGRRVGEEFEVEAPAGTLRYRILAIH